MTLLDGFCGAIATGSKPGYFIAYSVWGEGSRTQADNDVLHNCQGDGAQGCTIKDHACGNGQQD